MHVGVNLLVLTNRAPGGTGYHAISLFEALVEARDAGDAGAGATITGFAAENAASYFSARARRHLHLLPSGRGWRRMANELLRLPAAARRRGIDVMVNPAFFGAPWGSRRRVLILHDLYFRSEPHLVAPRRRWLLKMVVPLLGRASETIFSVSRATKAQIETYYPGLGARTTVLHSGVRALGRSGGPGGGVGARPVDRPYLLMVGHLTANKSPEVVVSALAALKRMGRDLMLVHVGDDRGRLTPLAAAAGVPADVMALGRQSDDVLAACYVHCEALVIPSLREGFGLPLIEAQARGAPVVASACDALLEIGGGSALFFPVGSAAACADAVLSLLDNPAPRQALIERGYRNAAEFRWERTAERLLAALGANGDGSSRSG